MDAVSPRATPDANLGITPLVVSDALSVGRFDADFAPGERTIRETNFCFGVSETSTLMEVEGKGAGLLGPDVVSFHCPGEHLRARGEGKVRSHWVVLSEAFVVDALAVEDSRGPFDTPFVRPPLSLLAELRHFLAQAVKTRDALWAQEVVTQLLPRLLGHAAPGMAQHTGASAVRLAREANALLRNDVCDAEPLDGIARRLGVSASYLAKSYRAVTGTTLHGHLTRLRVAEALRRLAGGAQDLTALALDLGYSSHSHFSAAFRRQVGLSPSAFRLAAQV